VLGPLLYVLYTAELFHVVARHGLHLHMYADDCQVYLSSPASDAATAVYRLSACDADVNDWMTASRLRLNPSKTQVMWLGSSQQLDKINIRDVPLLSASVTVVNTARDLGVILDSHAVVAGRACCFCLQEQLLPTEAASSSSTVTVCIGYRQLRH